MADEKLKPADDSAPPTETLASEGDQEAAEIWASFDEKEKKDEPEEFAGKDAEDAEKEMKADEDAATPAAAPEPQQTKVAAPAPVADPLATLTDEQKAEVAKLKQELDTWKGRGPKIQSENARLKRELEERQKAVAKAAIPSEITDEDWKKLKEDYPDLAKGIEKYVTQQLTVVAKPVTEIQAKITSDEEQRHVSNVVAQLAQKHPDWYDVKMSPAFSAWATEQPAAVRDIIENSRDLGELTWVIDTYKGITKVAASQPQAPAAPPSDALSKRRQAQMESAATPRAKVPLPMTSEPPDDPEALWAYWEEQDRKKQASLRH